MTFSRPGLLATLFISSLILFSCQKSTEVNPAEKAGKSTEGFHTGSVTRLSNGLLQAGQVTLTAPSTVNINTNFSIVAEVSCGRVAIDRGYILDINNNRVYKNLACNTANLLWEEVVAFQCYTTDATANLSLAEVGTYVYRTRHNAADGNCDGLGGNNQSGNCSGFNGNDFYCFSIEAVNPCVTAFTGQAISCGTSREAVYHFSSVNNEDYIKIQGGLTNFTGGDAVVTITGGNLTATQSTPGGSSNRIIRVEGSVTACEDITIRVTWNSSNGGTVITGSWSVVDENSVELAPSVAGLTCSGRLSQ